MESLCLPLHLRSILHATKYYRTRSRSYNCYFTYQQTLKHQSVHGSCDRGLGYLIDNSDTPDEEFSLAPIDRLIEFHSHEIVLFEKDGSWFCLRDYKLTNTCGSCDGSTESRIKCIEGLDLEDIIDFCLTDAERRDEALTSVEQN